MHVTQNLSLGVVLLVIRKVLDLRAFHVAGFVSRFFLFFLFCLAEPGSYVTPSGLELLWFLLPQLQMNLEV